MRGKITKRAVDDLAPAGGAETVLWDTEVKGFGVRARAARADTKVKDFGGRARATGGKSYILHYRAGAGRGAALSRVRKAAELVDASTASRGARRTHGA